MNQEPETPRETLPRPTRLITFLKDQLQDQTDACSRQCARDLLRCVEQARDGVCVLGILRQLTSVLIVLNAVQQHFQST